MTLTLTIAHKSGDSYQARIKVPGFPDKVVKPGESVDVGIHASNSMHIFEETLEKPKETYAQHVEGAGPLPDQDKATESQ